MEKKKFKLSTDSLNFFFSILLCKPLHRCLFPGSTAYNTYRSCTNPHAFELDNIRHDTKCVKASTEASVPAPTDSYVQELTKKIRQEVVDEVEVKLKQKVYDEVDAKVNQKVQDNLTLVLKKLVEANPTLNVNIGDFCAIIFSDTGGDQRT
ncbi:DNA polymerase delta subunit 2 [Orobanche minor]